MAEKVRILSIDGGGIRGIIPASVLAELERRAGKPVAELFDLIAGTSTGGILALGLTLDGGEGKPRHSAADLRALYAERGAEIFPPLRPSWLRTARGIAVERYPAGPLEDVLKAYLTDASGAEARLKDALKPVLVPAYEIELRQPFFFRSVRAAAEPELYDFPVWEAARATSAAPTYFEAARLRSPDQSDPFALVDGGVFANNPSMCAFADARARRHEEAHPSVAPEDRLRAADMVMVSLGTGELTKRLPWEEARDWGFYGWGRQLLGLVMDGVSDTADFQCRQLLGDAYHRFQTRLDIGTDGLDDASPRTVEALAERAKALVAQSGERLDRVCELVA